MSEPPAALAPLEQACGAAGAEWAGALPRQSTEVEADARAMSDAGLVRVTESLAVLARRVEMLQARCAAELAARSRGGEGADLARAQGFASPERLIAQATGRRYSEAAKLVAVGEATAQRASFTGESLPPRHPHVAAALEAGTLCVDAAETIRRFLDAVAARADPSESSSAEALLVERAPQVGVDGLVRLIKYLEARLDPDGVKPREDELRSRRGLKIWEDASGMINLRGAFDPATGAPIKLAVEALVGAELHTARDARRAFGEAGPKAGAADAERSAASDANAPAASLFAEDRTIAQLNADALADIARHSLGAKHAPPALRSATVVVRVDADAIVSGRGHATIDGIEQPVSVASARELAMSAGISPLLLDRRSERLDLGRATRLFTPAQKIVLVDRDGGCAWPGCRPAAVAFPSSPHRLVGSRRRRDEPRQRHHALQPPSPSGARRRLAHLHPRRMQLVRATTPPRPRATPSTGQPRPRTTRGPRFRRARRSLNPAVSCPGRGADPAAQVGSA